MLGAFGLAIKTVAAPVCRGECWIVVQHAAVEGGILPGLTAPDYCSGSLRRRYMDKCVGDRLFRTTVAM